MKRGVLLPSLAATWLLGTAAARAETYYVSTDGDDDAAGTSEGAPWRSIARVNATSLGAGDAVRFRRGDTFAGALVIGGSGADGAPLTIGAYGDDAAPRPVISGLIPIDGWTDRGDGVWVADVPGAPARLDVVLRDGELLPVGRWPELDDANGGYRTFESHVGGSSITDAELADAPDLTGAEIVVRTNHWILDRGTVSSHSGGTLGITFPFAQPYAFIDGFGYFVQHHDVALRDDGDWAYDGATGELRLRADAAPAAGTIEVAVVADLLTALDRDHLVIEDLTLLGAADEALRVRDGADLVVRDLRIRYATTAAMALGANTDLRVTGCEVLDSLNNGIVVTSRTSTDVVIDANRIERTAIRAGMGRSGDGQGQALIASVGRGLTIRDNQLFDTGYSAINWQGDDVLIEHNAVRGFCSVKDDGGGIYTYNGSADPIPVWQDRVIRQNVVWQGVGASAGTTTSPHRAAPGIYLDYASMAVTIEDNTLHDVRTGVHANNPRDVTIRGNTSFANPEWLSITRWRSGPGAPFFEISGMAAEDNVAIASDRGALLWTSYDHDVAYPSAATEPTRLASWGSFDADILAARDALPMAYAYADRSGPTVLSVTPPRQSVGRWAALTGHEGASTTFPLPPAYVIDTALTDNLSAASGFESAAEVAGVGSFSANAGHSVSWDESGQLTGPGALRVDAAALDDKTFTLLHAPIGPVSSERDYVLRFRARGSNDAGIARVGLRRRPSPYEALLDAEVVVIGPEPSAHEVWLHAPASVDDASWTISLLQAGGTTYLDDVEVMEVALGEVDARGLRFEVNPTGAAVALELDGTYVDARGGQWPGSLTLAPYTSAVLRRTGDAPPPGGDDAGGADGDDAEGDADGGCCGAGGTSAGPPTLLWISLVGLALRRRRRLGRTRRSHLEAA